MFPDSLFKKHNLTDLCMYALVHVQEWRDRGAGEGQLSWSDLDKLSITKCLKVSGFLLLE